MGDVLSCAKRETVSSVSVTGTVIKLTDQDKENLRNSWSFSANKKNYKRHAVNLFMRLFEQYPGSKMLFKTLQHIPIHELENNKTMKAHSLFVMDQLTKYIELLDDTDRLVHAIETLCKDHVKRNIHPKNFENLESWFMPFLQDILGDDCTEEVEIAWQKLLSAQTSCMYRMWTTVKGSVPVKADYEAYQ